MLLPQNLLPNGPSLKIIIQSLGVVALSTIDRSNIIVGHSHIRMFQLKNLLTDV